VEIVNSRLILFLATVVPRRTNPPPRLIVGHALLLALPVCPPWPLAPCSPTLLAYLAVVGVGVSGGRHHHRDSGDKPIYASTNIRLFCIGELRHGRRRLGRLLVVLTVVCDELAHALFYGV
jgi:hypothetical protein